MKFSNRQNSSPFDDPFRTPLALTKEGSAPEGSEQREPSRCSGDLSGRRVAEPLPRGQNLCGEEAARLPAIDRRDAKVAKRRPLQNLYPSTLSSRNRDKSLEINHMKISTRQKSSRFDDPFRIAVPPALTKEGSEQRQPRDLSSRDPLSLSGSLFLSSHSPLRTSHLSLFRDAGGGARVERAVFAEGFPGIAQRMQHVGADRRLAAGRGGANAMRLFHRAADEQLCPWPDDGCALEWPDHPSFGVTGLFDSNRPHDDVEHVAADRAAVVLRLLADPARLDSGAIQGENGPCHT
jgi:hypothetical protein